MKRYKVTFSNVYDKSNKTVKKYKNLTSVFTAIVSPKNTPLGIEFTSANGFQKLPFNFDNLQKAILESTDKYVLILCTWNEQIEISC